MCLRLFSSASAVVVSVFVFACSGTPAPSVGSGGSGGQSSVGGNGSSGGHNNTGGTAGTTGPSPIAGIALFFSDLTSGPKSGGQSDKGAFVTVWGNGFGDARGNSTITIGGGAADNYATWTNTKITFQLGSLAQSGSIVLHIADKGDSNPLPFTVRTGKIYFVASSGNDSNDGSYASPWKTIPKAKIRSRPATLRISVPSRATRCHRQPRMLLHRMVARSV
jgi:hypothetical protein